MVATVSVAWMPDGRILIEIDVPTAQALYDKLRYGGRGKTSTTVELSVLREMLGDRLVKPKEEIDAKETKA